MKEITGYPSIDETHKKNDKYFEKHPIIPDMSIYNALKFMSLKYRKDLAVDCLDLTATYQKLIDDAVVISKAFREIGIRSKDVITVSLPNYYQAIAIYLAANRIGATVTFLNTHASNEEINHYLNYFESPLFINYNKDEEYNLNVRKNTLVDQIITLSEDEVNKTNFTWEKKGLLGYNNLLTYGDLGLISNFNEKDFKTNYNGKHDSLMLFTSGSTGEPKVVVLTNENLLASGIYLKNTCKVKPIHNESCFAGVPFTYPYGFATSVLTTLLCGRKAILAPELSADNINYYINKKPNIIFGSPALLDLIKKNIPSDTDLSFINSFVSGGDFLYQSQIEEANDYFKSHGSHAVMANGFGNAETVATSTSSVGVPVKPNTVGKVLVGTDAMIIDKDNFKELKYGEEGTLYISGKHVFKEYYKNPSKTAKSKVTINGKTYFNTETRGFLDTDGYFYITGRESRYYINSSLCKIYCEHVQNIMSLIDIIDTVAFVEQPDDKLRFVGKAYIVLKDGVEPSQETEDYIYYMCSKSLKVIGTDEIVSLKENEIPSSIEFVKELPKTKADKVDYELLKQMAKDEFEQNNKMVRTLIK